MIRAIAIIAYFLIFLKGSMILIPFGLLLVTGLFEAEPIMRILIVLADLSLITLVIISFKEKSKLTLAIEIIIYLLLLLPILKTFMSFPFEWFNYFSFLFPTSCFLLLFPLSIFNSYKKEEETWENNLSP